jgi:hypothetical protein
MLSCARVLATPPRLLVADQAGAEVRSHYLA